MNWVSRIFTARWIIERYFAHGWQRVSGVYDYIPALPLEEAIVEMQNLVGSGRDASDFQYRIRRKWSSEVIPYEAVA